jgi:NAD(P)-dependent dehydrogenase (short-subunit alcohol dehydrogenase family)
MVDSASFSGQVAIVTGASRGIGWATAQALARAGAQVIITGRKADAIAEAARSIGDGAVGIVAHSGDIASLEALAAATLDRFGRVDILVNNAATNPHFGAMLEAEDSLWAKTIDVNIMGNIWLTRAVVPAMRAQGGGRIINIASIVGTNPGQYQGIYSMTKAAIISLTKTLAMELGGDNILVNAIAPGLIRTKFASVLWENEQLRAQVEGRTALGRLGEPDDIAGAALFLASSASQYLTGAVLTIDGGLTLGSL